jgi:hypothetical protein
MTRLTEGFRARTVGAVRRLRAWPDQSATAILASLTPDDAMATQVEFTDPDIVAEYPPSPKGHGQARAAAQPSPL